MNSLSIHTDMKEVIILTVDVRNYTITLWKDIEPNIKQLNVYLLKKEFLFLKYNREHVVIKKVNI